jgi:hypothetical protein
MLLLSLAATPHMEALTGNFHSPGRSPAPARFVSDAACIITVFTSFHSRQKEDVVMGWIITKDKVADTSVEAPSNQNAVGLTGPSGLSPEIEARLKAGEGNAFRMFDDDNNLYYVGRFLEDETTADLEAAEFQPLDNFGTPNAGCTYMEVKDAQGKWVML